MLVVFIVFFIAIVWIGQLKKMPFFKLSTNTKVLIGVTIFSSRIGDGIAILRGYPLHANV